MAKLLSICLRTMLPIAIHPIQLGFIRQRSILDNVYALHRELKYHHNSLLCSVCSLSLSFYYLSWQCINSFLLFFFYFFLVQNVQLASCRLAAATFLYRDTPMCFYWPQFYYRHTSASSSSLAGMHCSRHHQSLHLHHHVRLWQHNLLHKLHLRLVVRPPHIHHSLHPGPLWWSTTLPLSHSGSLHHHLRQYDLFIPL